MPLRGAMSLLIPKGKNTMKKKISPDSNVKTTLVTGLCLLLLLTVATIGITVTSAHSIDYLAMAISPAADFNGASGNFSVNAPVAPGATISFSLKYSISSQGGTTTFPRTVEFGYHSGSPDVAVIGLALHTFIDANSSFTDSLSIIAPATPGAYNVKIDPTSGTGGRGGLTSGGGIVIHFKVAQPTPPPPACNHVATSLTLTDACITYHQPTTSLSAILNAGVTPLADKLVEFKVDGNLIGTAFTNISGVAQLPYNSGLLSVGDHTVLASFAGDACDYQPSSGSANLGVSYVFVGFQQPVITDGSGLFAGRTIPVKIKLTDYFGVSVPDAQAHVYFAAGTTGVAGEVATPLANTNGENGNAMRYDATAGQYIFNWDIAGLVNGTYTIRVDLGEGKCGTAHTVVVPLKKKGNK